ncbi:MAG TPA: hypothetical protein VMR41_03860 [Patescibacteria group bacterium]|nr:hypothetical protein [Patescibacteria group bacterium]
MQLQNTFFFVAIVFMIVQIALFIGIIVFLIYLTSEIKRFFKMIETQVINVQEFINHPQVLASNVGSFIVQQAISKLRSYFHF